MAKGAAEVIGRVESVVTKLRKSIGGEEAETTKAMTPDEFLAHAASEVEKAKGEAAGVAKARLAKLAEAVNVAKAADFEGAETFDVPLYSATAKSESSWFERARKRLTALKAGMSEEDDEDTSKAGGGEPGDEDEQNKGKDGKGKDGKKIGRAHV